MRWILVGVVLLVFLLSVSVNVQATIYEVKQDGTGNFTTIQGCADDPQVQAGDTCIVYPGAVPYDRVNTYKSGSPDSPITFKASGEGVVTHGFKVENAQYITIDGFEITNTSNGWANGPGVALIDTKYCEVKNNYIHRTMRDGIMVSTFGDINSTDSSYNKIINNTIKYAGVWTGISIYGAYQLLENNDISNTIQCPTGYDGEASGEDADGVKFAGTGHTFRDNYIHDLVQFYTGPEGDNNGTCRSDCEPPHQDCWQSFRTASNITFEDNICDLDNDLKFYYSNALCRTCEPGETGCNPWSGYQGILMEAGEGSITNVTFVNNIFKNGGTSLKVHATFELPASDILIAHNNFMGPGLGYSIEVTGSDNAIVKNNLIYETLSSGGRYIGGVTGTGIEIGNNLIYVSNGTVSSNYPNDIYEEPNLTNISNDNYYPLPGSPVIDAGFDVGIMYDYDDNPRPIDGDNNGSAEFDIGIYEYQSVVFCGDGSCDFGENCSSCPQDCSCQYPIALYHLDEGSGTTTADSSGNGNNGTVYGAAWTSESISGSSLEFNGTDGYVEVQDDDSLSPEKITVSLWIQTYENTGDTGSWNGMIESAAGDGYSHGWRILDYYNHILLQINFGGPSPERISNSSALLPVNQYVHLAFTYDGEIVKLYQDGEQIYTTLNDSGINWYSDPSNMYIGRAQTYFNGTIDEVRIYNRALSEGGISELYNMVKADINDDSYVNLFDLSEVTSRFGIMSGEPGWDSKADLIADGEIDIYDLVFVASRFT